MQINRDQGSMPSFSLDDLDTNYTETEPKLTNEEVDIQVTVRLLHFCFLNSQLREV